MVEILKERLVNKFLELYYSLYYNLQFLMKKKLSKYQIINIAMNINRVIIKDINLPLLVDKFLEEFTKIQIILLINFFSRYNQIELNNYSKNLITFITLLELL